jgi:mono/diheme cytochrome c family protein
VPRVIGTVAFVLAFIILALSVLAVAMRAGRRRSAGSRGETPGTRRAWGIGLPLAGLLIGVGLPLWVVLANSSSHAKQAPGGIELTQAQADGRHVFAIRCANCHTLAASKAVGRVGPNLDQLNGGNVPKALILDAIKNGRARGQGQMPAGVVDGQDAQNVADYVSRVAGRG